MDNPEMQQHRQKAAKALLEGTHRNTAPVLDYLDMVGFLVRHDSIDVNLVWHQFFTWVLLYAGAAEQYIPGYMSRLRESDAAAWEDFYYLYDKLIDIESEKTGLPRERVMLSEEELRAGLRSESLATADSD